nr:hypothetical protein [Tanacetum cinerariifolium]
MDMTIDQQVALDEALVPHASRLRIGKSNFRLKSDISSKESTLQLVYDFLRLTPFFKAFLVTADVPEIYMQEFWATATVHLHSIRFKMDNKKHIFNLEYFREMLHICPRLPGQTFDELPFEEEILAFLRFLRHSGEIRRLTDVNINKLHQPWRSFAAIINKCLSKKSTGYDSLRLSQAQIFWGLYHKRNVDFAYLLWEDFVYQVEHKDAEKSNEMYYPRFTKVIIHYFLSKDHSIPRRNKFGAMLSIELTNDDIGNSKAYKEYYVVATGAAPPKTKASVRKTKSSFDTTITPPTAAAGTRLSTSAKGKQPAKASKAKSQIVLSEVAMTEAEQLKLATKKACSKLISPKLVVRVQMKELVVYQGDDQDDDDAQDDDDDDENKDDDDQDKGDDNDDQEEGNDDDQDSNEEDEEFIHLKLSIHDEEETKDEESFDPIANTPENTDDEGNDEENLGLNVGKEEGQDEGDDEDELYRDVNINLERRVVQMDDVHTTQEFEDSHVTLTPTTSQMNVQVPTSVAPLPLSAPTLTPSTIATISTVPQAPTLPTTAPSSLLQDLPNFGSLFGFDHRLKTLEANFSEFVQTNQFAGAVSSILEIVQRYMDQRMNETVKVAVQIQSDRLLDEAQAENEEFLKNLDENIQKIIKEQVKEQVKLKKILIKKREGNKSIHRSDEQRNLYKALVEAYESDKIILDTYGETVTLKRRRDDDADKDEEPSAGSDRGSKRRREGKEPESTSAPKEKATRTTGKSTQGSKSRQTYASESATAEESMQTTHDLEEPSHLKFETDQLDWINPKGQQYPRNLLKPLLLIPNSRGRHVIPFDHFIKNDLEYLRGSASSCKYTTSVTKTKAADYGHIKWIEDLVPHTMWIQEPIVEWHNYKHLDWITVRRDDDKLYKFKEGDFKRLRIQDIEDMLLLLVQGKLTNLTVEERFAFNKKLNLTRPDTYRSDLKRKEAYTAYSNPRGFIYQNKDKQNRLTRIDELNKFSDGTLIDVRTALDDRLKGIRMKYLPQTIWRKSNKERDAAMIQAIDKQLKTRRIMRSLERFIGGRLYEEDFRMLQQTI